MRTEKGDNGEVKWQISKKQGEWNGARQVDTHDTRRHLLFIQRRILYKY